MRLAAALLGVLALTACNGGSPPPSNSATVAPAPGDPIPEPTQTPLGQGDAPRPNAPNPTQSPPSRFVVCPGDPRCPPAETRPGGR